MKIKRVKLNYIPYATRKSNEVAYIVSSDHVNAVNKSINHKVYRNALEKQETYADLYENRPVVKKKI